MKKLGLNSGYIGSDQRTTAGGVIGHDKFYLERKVGRFEPILSFTGLLSVYPGAAAAYSLRLLDNFYQGSAIKVRRASDNAEQDISFINNELDISTLETFCSGTDGYVTTWYDQSGNGNDTTQTTASNQPQIVNSGSVILENGKPCVQFDGSEWQLVSNSSIGSDELTMFFTYKQNAINTSRQIHVSAGVYQNSGFIYNYRGDSSLGNYRLTQFYSGGQTDLNFTDTITSYMTDTVLISSTNGASVRRNSVLKVNGSATMATISSNFAIGSTGIFTINANVQEIILYPSDQSSNRIDIETNINNYYNIF